MLLPAAYLRPFLPLAICALVIHRDHHLDHVGDTPGLAFGADVKEYAETRISFFAFPSSRTTASVAPPRGEKKTSMDGTPTVRSAEIELGGDEQAKRRKKRGHQINREILRIMEEVYTEFARGGITTVVATPSRRRWGTRISRRR